VFGLDVVILALVALVTLAVGGVIYAVFYEKVTDDVAAKRLERIVEIGSAKAAEAQSAANQRSKRSVQSALKEFEEKQKAKTAGTKPTLAMRLARAGLGWDRKTFTLVSIGIGAVMGFGLLVLSGQLVVALGGAVVGGIGVPAWLLDHLAKRRQKSFIAELPTAIDLIVRGIRSGLPLGDCLRMVATETKDPVRSEFRTIMEAQQMGIPVGEACLKLYERIPLQEANFFGIVVAIQQKAGGNLSEALGNLSTVLRERKKMADKIKAMSMEAKASAAIIGSLPFIVGGLVFLTSPSYITVLFVATSGKLILIGGLLYMMIGIFVMRQMINFDF